MEFYWREKDIGKNEIDIFEMSRIIGEIKEDILADLLISPQINKAPIDLITIYAMYQVFSKKGEVRENTRAWFLERYRSRLTYYLENKNSLPEYRKFLRNLFNDLLDRILKKKIEEMNLDSYLSKSENTSIIIEIILWGEKIKSRQNFKESLKKLCRKEFKYAEKRLDRVGDSKNSYKEIIDLFLKKTEEQILEAISSAISKDVEEMNKAREKKIIGLKDQILSSGKTSDIVDMLNLLEKGDGKIFVEIYWMVRAFSIIDTNDFEMEKYFLEFFSREVIDRFKKSSDRRKPVKQTEELQHSREIERKLISYVEETPMPFGEPIKKIPENKEKIIDSIVQSFCLDENLGKGLKKYLIRLLTNGRDCRLSSLKKAFGITEIDENTLRLFEKAGIVLRHDILTEEENPDQTNNCNETDSNEDKTETESSSSEIEEQKKSFEKSEIGDIDLFAIFDREIGRYNYKVSSKKKIDKQIQELCSTDTSIKQILCIEMQKSSFGSPKKKKGRSYYTIEIGVTGIRFILFKCNDGTFIIDGVYNHDDYLKRIKEIN